MVRKKYYVNLSTGDITQNNTDNNAAYTIFADEREAGELRSKMENMHDASFASFFRAHIPIVPYHHDPQNDMYDKNLREAFQLLYELGDDQAKQHVESIGILTENANDRK